MHTLKRDLLCLQRFRSACAPEPETSEAPNQLTVSGLRAKLKSLGKSVQGKKAELVARLGEAAATLATQQEAAVRVSPESAAAAAAKGEVEGGLAKGTQKSWSSAGLLLFFGSMAAEIIGHVSISPPNTGCTGLYVAGVVEKGPCKLSLCKEIATQGFKRLVQATDLQRFVESHTDTIHTVACINLALEQGPGSCVHPK